MGYEIPSRACAKIWGKSYDWTLSLPVGAYRILQVYELSSDQSGLPGDALFLSIVSTWKYSGCGFARRSLRPPIIH